MGIYQQQANFSDIPFERTQGFLQGVYSWMAGGLLVTTLVAFLTVSTALVNFAVNPIFYFGSFLIELGLVFYISARINKLSYSNAVGLFMLYSALNGFTLSLILLAYSSASLTTAFLSTVVLFGTMTVVGRTTQMDLSKMGTILFIGLIGIILASIINIFLGSTIVELAISILGVIIFTGLTAYDTQRLTKMSRNYSGGSSLVVLGALILYLDFVNLFLFLLRLMGRRN